MISIVLPTYNSLRFLEERVNTILNQTYSNWECVVIDGFSNDGTFEYLQQIAKEDSRFALYQYPPQGPYDAWNIGIEKASGEYVYIATSDDTMSHHCLEKMVTALIKNPDCGFAHCNLSMIDKESRVCSNWRDRDKNRYFGHYLDTLHKRIAPYTGILYGYYENIYNSITELLIRKDVFDQIGIFLTDKGIIADIEWTLRLSMMYSSIHVPEELATWRIHDNQLTSQVEDRTQHKKKVKELFTIALNTVNFKRQKQFFSMFDLFFDKKRFINSSYLSKFIILFKYMINYPFYFKCFYSSLRRNKKITINQFLNINKINSDNYIIIKNEEKE